MAVILRCPHCEVKFRCEFSQSSGWPDYCPNKKCGIFMGTDRADDDIVMPFIRSAITKANDKVYRDAEAASEVRAERAAEMAGVPVSDMSSMKITNMSDRRDTPVKAITIPDSVVTRQMQAMGNDGWLASGAANLGANTGAVTVNGSTTQGIEPRAGMKALGKLQSSFGGRR